MGGLNDRWLLTRTSVALLLANARYWSSVAPVVRAELKRWRAAAAEIEDTELRALALSKLRHEGFNADAAAMIATLAPRSHRRSVVEAIVALELLFDYLDGLTERSSADPLSDGRRAFASLIDAVSIPATVADEASERDTYLKALSGAVAAAMARLPASAAVTKIAQHSAARSGQAQTRMHAAAQLGIAQLEQWGRDEVENTYLGWRELVTGAASSVLVLHALIVAAADPSTNHETAAQLAEAYLPNCVLLTLLDGLIDFERDTTRNSPGTPTYLSLYQQPEELAETMAEVGRQAVERVRSLPHGSHHVMLLTGIVAYYSSAPGSDSQLARTTIAPVHQAFEPLISFALALMRAWRRAKCGPIPTRQSEPRSTPPPEGRERSREEEAHNA
ncbi:MAG: DUF2600 family protein [Solirubrobacteraceae bacterium]